MSGHNKPGATPTYSPSSVAVVSVRLATHCRRSLQTRSFPFLLIPFLCGRLRDRECVRAAHGPFPVVSSKFEWLNRRSEGHSDRLTWRSRLPSERRLAEAVKGPHSLDHRQQQPFCKASAVVQAATTRDGGGGVNRAHRTRRRSESYLSFQSQFL